VTTVADPRDIIVAPVISEKATLVGETRRQVVFEVLPDATKAEIKAAAAAAEAALAKIAGREAKS